MMVQTNFPTFKLSTPSYLAYTLSDIYFQYGPWCQLNDPCDNEWRCEDRCNGQHVCQNIDIRKLNCHSFYKINKQQTRRKNNILKISDVSLGDLREYMGTASQKGVHHTGTPEKGIDGKLFNLNNYYSGCAHSTHTELEWWKVEFNQFVEIDHIHLYAFPNINNVRNDNVLILAILNIVANV